MSSAGLAVCAKKNQCHQLEAKRASQRSSASTIGTPSITTSRVTPWSTASRCATPHPRSWPTAAYSGIPSAAIPSAIAAAIARLDWSVGRDSP